VLKNFPDGAKIRIRVDVVPGPGGEGTPELKSPLHGPVANGTIDETCLNCVVLVKGLFSKRKLV
jgi:hypothetical protein